MLASEEIEDVIGRNIASGKNAVLEVVETMMMTFGKQEKLAKETAVVMVVMVEPGEEANKKNQ